MLKALTLATATLALVAATASQPAVADNGQITAGVLGGLAVGAVIGSQMQGERHYYGGPAYSHQNYQPVYANCRIEREQWVDGYGRYRVRRIRVCD